MKIYNLLKIRSEMTNNCIYILSERKRDVMSATDLFRVLVSVDNIVDSGKNYTGIEFFVKTMEENLCIIMLDDYDDDISLCMTADNEYWVLNDKNRHTSYIIEDKAFISERF